MRLTIYFGLIMAMYSLGFVIMSAFSSFYLLDIGLKSGQIGILIAIGSFLAVCFEPIVGGLIDRHPKVSTRKSLFMLSVLIIFLGIALILIPSGQLTAKTVVYGVGILALMLAQPFYNALGIDTLRSGRVFRFEVGRAMGSLGYAAGSSGFGFVSTIFGPKCVPAFFCGAFLVLALMLVFYPIDKPLQRKEGKEKHSLGNPYLLLKKYKRFAIMLIGLIGIYFSHTCINTFALQIVTPKGGTSQTMGIAASIAAVVELTTTLLFPFYRKYFRLSFLVKISGVFFILKIFLSYAVATVGGFYAVQLIQIYGWGLLSIGIVYYVDGIVAEEDKAQGQAYAGMAMTIGNLIGSLFGGALIDDFGVNTMLLVGTAAAIVGTIIVAIAGPKTEPVRMKASRE